MAKGQTSRKSCEHCLHRWRWLNPGLGCGTSKVKQASAIEARSENGDCGPKGRYFELDEGVSENDR